jgi:hypothetical protein
MREDPMVHEERQMPQVPVGVRLGCWVLRGDGSGEGVLGFGGRLEGLFEMEGLFEAKGIYSPQ